MQTRLKQLHPNCLQNSIFPTDLHRGKVFSPLERVDVIVAKSQSKQNLEQGEARGYD